MGDYVIVGAGSAGCVLAARLSEDPSAEVTLIEAGGPDSAREIHVPIALGQLWKSQYDWDYMSQPEPGLDGRYVYLPRGKTLGGSSSLNAMIYIRGHRADYDGWAADGARGWSYNEVLPYFRKAEANERGEDQFHGKLGPLSVSDGRSRHPLMDAFVRAGVEAGYQENPDFNGATQDGVGWYQCTQRNGMRCSTAGAYLRPAMARPNLKVITDALATRILFDGARASGVEIARNGALEAVHADAEVILAAGPTIPRNCCCCRASGPRRTWRRSDSHPPGFAGRRRAPGPSDGLHELVYADGNAHQRFDSGKRRPAANGRTRSADFELCRGRRLLPNPRRARGARRTVPRDAGDHARAGSGAAGGPCLLLQPVRAETDEPRQGLSPDGQSGVQAVDSAQLLCDRRGPPQHGRRDAHRARHRRPARASRPHQGAVRRSKIKVRSRYLGLRPAQHADRLSSDQHLRDRAGGR